MERQITQSMIATAAAEGERNDIYHGMPGSVVSYDATQETATIQPMTNDVRFDLDTGARISEAWDPMAGVPVAWPRFGGFVIKGTLAQYDPVILLALDLDPTPFRSGGRSNKPVDPGDIRRHGGGYWWAFPANLLLGHPQGSVTGQLTIGVEGQAPIITINASNIQLGASGGDFLALASKVNDAIKKWAEWAASGTGSGYVPPSPLTQPGTPPGTVNVGSTLIKAQ